MSMEEYNNIWCVFWCKKKDYDGIIVISVYTLDMVISELFDDLTVDLIFQRFRPQCSFKDLVSQLTD